MKAGEYIRTLGEFVTGEISMPSFKQLVEERLFELRQDPEMTDEKRLLSSVELHLHEVEEGQRDSSEVYTHVQFILDTILLAKLTSGGETTYLSSTSLKSPCVLSKTFDIDPDSPDKQRTVTKKLPLVASR